MTEDGRSGMRAGQSGQRDVRRDAERVSLWQKKNEDRVAIALPGPFAFQDSFSQIQAISI
jgi:hypothetical protein